jgi:hypothetical protein
MLATVARFFPTRRATSFLRQTKFRDQTLIRLRFFDWVEILSLQVFDQRNLKRCVVAGIRGRQQEFSSNLPAARRASAAHQQSVEKTHPVRGVRRLAARRRAPESIRPIRSSLLRRSFYGLVGIWKDLFDLDFT